MRLSVLLPLLLLLLTLLTSTHSYKPACEVIKMMEKSVWHLTKSIKGVEVKLKAAVRIVKYNQRIIAAKRRGVDQQYQRIREQRKAIELQKNSRRRRGQKEKPICED